MHSREKRIEIVGKYLAGVPLKIILEDYRVTHTAIRLWLLKAGLKGRRQRRSSSVKESTHECG